MIQEFYVTIYSPFSDSNLTNSSEQLNNHIELKATGEHKMNKKQKYVLTIGIILIALAIIYWYAQGTEVFTKSQVLVDKTTDLDRMLGVLNKQYVDKFVFGLFPSGMASLAEMISAASLSGLIIFITGIFIYLFRNKTKETK